ncbi:TonB-dependent receptor [Hydrogenophaga crassostreae]|uniref:TonB-dependent receptor n=1 Tax=Hydrogenophaga crassostreae TaxID=1763535 RepID=A0A167H432_9BURK|nr:TonB-dependent receptor [Hydrogenophaga crassostreae]AOW13055.1 TonB-dependent receptor [Hydrogenophaga crassostreae]OAD40239.1 TonB-dependent receptor [Hydrogenophaga crassostreae]
MLNSSLRAPLAALPLALLAAFSHAQTAPVPSLPTTVVTATRVAQPITDVVADVTIVDRAAIERSGATGLADVLGRLPGVSLARNGGLGATTSVYVRGAETRFTAVFVDGVRIDSQSTGGASWNAIPLSQVDRIELVRGPAAAVYGSDAMGGVIQIFTRKGEAGFSPSVEVGVGSYGTRKVAASISGQQGVVDYALGVSRETSDGFNAQPESNPDRDGYRNTAFSGSLGWQFNAANRIDVNLLDSDLDAQYDGFSPGNDDRGQSDLQTLGVNWSAEWSDSYSTKLAVTRGRDRYATSPSPYLTDTSVTSYLWQNNWKLGDSQLTAALERREDRLDNASTSPVITERSQNALALGYALRSGAHTLQLNARRDDDSEFGGQSTGSAAYAFGFMPNWRALVSMGNAFRAPTLFQRFSRYGVASLRPETSNNIETGVKYDQGATSFSAIVYRNKVSDLITYVAGPGTCANGTGDYAGCYGNTAKAQYSGLTLAGAQRVGMLAFSGSLDLQNPKDASTGKQLARRAKQAAKLAVSTGVAGWNLGAETEYVGKRFNDARNNERLDGYTLVNFSVSTPVAKDWTLLGRVDNIADTDYETAKGYATAGRTFYVGLKWAPN